MSKTFYTLFDTSLGRCGVAWGPAGIVAVSFPEASDEKTAARGARPAPATLAAPPRPLAKSPG